jgi:hypothetical protein
MFMFGGQGASAHMWTLETGLPMMETQLEAKKKVEAEKRQVVTVIDWLA